VQLTLRDGSTTLRDRSTTLRDVDARSASASRRGSFATETRTRGSAPRHARYSRTCSTRFATEAPRLATATRAPQALRDGAALVCPCGTRFATEAKRFATTTRVPQALRDGSTTLRGGGTTLRDGSALRDGSKTLRDGDARTASASRRGRARLRFRLETSPGSSHWPGRNKPAAPMAERNAKVESTKTTTRSRNGRVQQGDALRAACGRTAERRAARRPPASVRGGALAAHASRREQHASRRTHHASRRTHHASRRTHHASRRTHHASWRKLRDGNAKTSGWCIGRGRVREGARRAVFGRALEVARDL